MLIEKMDIQNKFPNVCNMPRYYNQTTCGIIRNIWINTRGLVDSYTESLESAVSVLFQVEIETPTGLSYVCIDVGNIVNNTVTYRKGQLIHVYPSSGIEFDGKNHMCHLNPI